MPASLTGNQLVCATLEFLGVRHIFGLPGTQNLGFFEALRGSNIRTVLMSSELGAGFAANGYYRVSGKVGVFTTIPGPGFTFAITALAEARHDSAAVLYLVSAPPAGGTFALQAVDQTAIAAPLVKRIFDVGHAADLPSAINDAFAFALDGEPGPVMVQVARRAWSETVPASAAAMLSNEALGFSARLLPSAQQLSTIIDLLRESRRPVIYAGQGCTNASAHLITLAEHLGAPVVMTRSARGVVPMDHRLALAFDFNADGYIQFNELLDSSDLILVLGCKLAHNGSSGFQLHLSPEKLVHADASSEVLGASYPCRMALQCDVPALLKGLAERTTGIAGRTPWGQPLIASLQRPARVEIGHNSVEPVIDGATPNTVAGFFHALRRALPRDACVVTDTGNHQIFTTRYFKSLVSRGLIIPSDFQSMGFGLPAAIGAKLAAPRRAVVAIVGDGSIAMCGMELLTMAREKLQMTVIVFNDGALGQIRQQQLAQFGQAHATHLNSPDLSVLAEAVGANYLRLEGDTEAVLRQAIGTGGVTLLEVSICDSMGMRTSRAKGFLRSQARSKLNDSTLAWLKKLLGRPRAA